MTYSTQRPINLCGKTHYPTAKGHGCAVDRAADARPEGIEVIGGEVVERARTNSWDAVEGVPTGQDIDGNGLCQTASDDSKGECGDGEELHVEVDNEGSGWVMLVGLNEL